MNNSNSKTNLVACEGYYKDTINYRSGPINEKLLMNDDNGGKDSFVDTWYPIPLARVEDSVNTYQGTYKHVDCPKVCFIKGKSNLHKVF